MTAGVLVAAHVRRHRRTVLQDVVREVVARVELHVLHTLLQVVHRTLGGAVGAVDDERDARRLERVAIGRGGSVAEEQMRHDGHRQLDLVHWRVGRQACCEDFLGSGKVRRKCGLVGLELRHPPDLRRYLQRLQDCLALRLVGLLILELIEAIQLC